MVTATVPFGLIVISGGLGTRTRALENYRPEVRGKLVVGCLQVPPQLPIR